MFSSMPLFLVFCSMYDQFLMTESINIKGSWVEKPCSVAKNSNFWEHRPLEEVNMLFSRFAPYIQWFLPFRDNKHCEFSEPLSCCGKSKTTVKYPWGFREQDPKSINKDPKSINKDPKSTWNFREKTVKKKGVRRLKSRVQTIADIRACALHVYMHVLVDRLKIWSTSVGWRDLARFCIFFCI